MNQQLAPIAQALEQLRNQRIVPFDVPGHKRGKANLELTALMGERALEIDVNSMKMLDNLTHPISVIKEAEILAAEAFGAHHAFFMVNGTTSAVQNMIFTLVNEGDGIILPRNVHKSVINALVISGGIPIYVDTPMHSDLEIATGMPLEKVAEAIKANPHAKAVLVNNPTYYGICSDLQAIVDLCHDHGLKVLVDEAHGTHLYFNQNLPVSAMAAGADMAAVSMHKSGGSLTQSSFLLIGPSMVTEKVRKIINLTQTTSANYLLLASLDLARKNLALDGTQIFTRVIELAQYARQEVNAVGGYYAYSTELVDGYGIVDYDVTKLSIKTTGIGLTGIEVYDLLRDDYGIQIEFGDTANILAYISVGDRYQDIERLVGALADIKRRFGREPKGVHPYIPIDPTVLMTPKAAFHAERRQVLLESAVGFISAEMVMCYPPGIPLLAPGELVTQEIVDYINYARDKGCSLMGAEDEETRSLYVIEVPYEQQEKEVSNNGVMVL